MEEKAKEGNHDKDLPTIAKKAKLGHNQDGGGDLLLSDQQLLDIENKGQDIRSMHPGFKRTSSMVDLPEVPAKRPRVLGPKLSARFGTLTSNLVAKEGQRQTNTHLGDLVKKRSSESPSDLTERPRCDGFNSPSEHGTLNHDASSSSR